MCRHAYKYEYNCFMYVHMCNCMYVMTMYRAVRIPLVSNYTIYIIYFIVLVVI